MMSQVKVTDFSRYFKLLHFYRLEDIHKELCVIMGLWYSGKVMIEDIGRRVAEIDDLFRDKGEEMYLEFWNLFGDFIIETAGS